jgi:hypothetical protein
MDNADVCIGLIEGAQLFDAIGARDEAERCRAHIQRTSAALARFWLPDKHYFAWIKGESDATRTFEKPYPDGVINLYLAAAFDPPPAGLWRSLVAKFSNVPRLTPDLWLAAAQRCGTPQQIADFTAAAVTRANSDDLDLQIASRLLPALAGDIAQPIIVHVDLPTTQPSRTKP